MITEAFGNSRNITARTIREQRTQRMLAIGHKSPVEEQYTVAVAESLFWQGFDAYVRGAPIEDLGGEAIAMQGYWYANSAEAYCDSLDIKCTPNT